MVPSASTPQPAEKPLLQTIQTLYNLLVCASDHRGPLTEEAMLAETQTLHANLLSLSRAASTMDIDLPKDIVDYVQTSRNPDIYTREMAEITQRNNQKLKGKMGAFEEFALLLGREIGGGVPELRGDVKAVLEKTVPERGTSVGWDDEVVIKTEGEGAG